jgi:membrane protease YdiL (CAAX protease family)
MSDPAAAAGIGVWGWFHLVCFGVVLPYLAVLSARRLPSMSQRPRKPHFISILMVQGVTVIISLRVAEVERIALFPDVMPSPLAIAVGVVMTILTIVVLRPRWRDAVVRRDPRVHFVMPRDAVERRLWVAVSLAAGSCEEITYRGVMYVLLLRLAGDPLIAAIAAAALFGAAHAVQGWKGVSAIALIGLSLQGLVLLAGSLYVAMAVHVLYDLVTGFTYGKLGEELGYPIEGVPPVTAGPAVS